MKSFDISVPITPSFTQVFSYKNPVIAAQALSEWTRVANVGDEITVKVTEKQEDEG